MSATGILIVEDTPALALAYSVQLEGAGFACTIVDHGEAALEALEGRPGDFAAVLLDLQLPDVDGLEWLKANPHIAATWPIVVATADGSIARAIQAMRLGAYDFLVKPVASSRLIPVLNSAALAKSAMPPRQAQRDCAAIVAAGFDGFIGASDAMQAIYQQIASVARSRATVFITGESGTGKEVCAEAIHNSGPRARFAMLAVNCGAIPEHLLESELFGHLKGSFTGAFSDRIGLVQAANQGTLFLDEICELKPELQVKLLRFLQTGTIQKVGSSRTEDVDVRIICATNRDPLHEVAEGRFREDLYYRLAVLPIDMPPLRARGGDVLLIANAFLQRFAAEEGKVFAPIAEADASALLAHGWAGNVRELQNVIRRAVVIHPGPDLPLAALMPATGHQSGIRGSTAAGSFPGAPIDPSQFVHAVKRMTLEDIERLVIEQAIAESGGSLTTAARGLGVSPSTLYRKRERWVSPE